MKTSLALQMAAACLFATAAAAADTKFYDDGELALVAAVRDGIVEPPAAVFHNGTRVGDAGFNVIEAYDRVPETTSYPLTAVHLVANTFQRLTYQKANGTTGALGTSLIGAPSYRTPLGLQLVPTVTRADVTTGLNERYKVALQAKHGSSAHVGSAVSFPDPPIGASRMKLDVAFTAMADIALATGAPYLANDRFRALTVSSMYASTSQYDANLIRFEDASGVVQTFPLTAATPRDAHLFAAPVEIGSWFEVLKLPGSTWFPDSPSIRVSVLTTGGLRLGLQGYLANTTDPNDDSLSLWLEWLDAPDVVVSGTSFGASFQITAVGPPVLVNAKSRKVHGTAGTFDLPLNKLATDPTTEPRSGPNHAIVFVFDKAVVGGVATVTEGTATAGAPTFAGNEMVVPLSAVSNQQYVTIAVGNVIAADGGTGGADSVRVGFLLGDINQNRVVTVSDVARVNAQIAQPVTPANYLMDVNASGAVTVADKAIVNRELTKSLPAP